MANLPKMLVAAAVFAFVMITSLTNAVEDFAFCNTCFETDDETTVKKFQEFFLGGNTRNCLQEYSGGIGVGEGETCVTVKGTLKSGKSFVIRAKTRGANNSTRCEKNLDLIYDLRGPEKEEKPELLKSIKADIKEAEFCFCVTTSTSGCDSGENRSIVRSTSSLTLTILALICPLVSPAKLN